MSAYLNATLAEQTGRSDEALALLQNVKLDPAAKKHGGDFIVQLGLGQIYMRMGQNEAARKALQRALMGPSRPTHLLPWAYLSLATIANKLHDKDTVQRATSSIRVVDALLEATSGASEQARQLSE